MCSTIISPGSRVSYFAGNLHARKLNKAQTKESNITGLQYFRGLWFFTRMNRSGLNFFNHLYSLHFTSSKFAPTSLFASASTSASASARARCRHYRSRVHSAGCCIPVPPSISHPAVSYRYLLPLPCWLKSSETAKISTSFGGRSGSLLPSSSDTSFSIYSSSYASFGSSVFSASLSPPPQSTLRPHPHRFLRSPIRPPHNRHCLRRRPN